jgi:trk system potassium uptake protein TrkA
VRVLLGGSGQSLVHIAKAILSKGYTVNIISPDQTLCNWLAKEFRADIICGDPTNLEILNHSGIGDSQVVVAVMPDDADNYLFCQLAMGKFKIARTVAVVHNPANEAFFQQMGIQVTVSLANVIGAMVEEGLHEEITNLDSLENGKIVSMLLLITKKSPLWGKKPADIPVIPQSRVALIIRDGQFLGDDNPLEDGDKLAVFSAPAVQGRVIKAYLGEK